jgi:hypothetical protein
MDNSYIEDSYIKLQQNQEFEYAKLLDSIQDIHKLINNDNTQKKELIETFETQNDLVNNIKNHNKYNNPKLNEKYEIENDKLNKIKDKLDNFLENNNKLHEQLELLQKKIQEFNL